MRNIFTEKEDMSKRRPEHLAPPEFVRLNHVYI